MTRGARNKFVDSLLALVILLMCGQQASADDVLSRGSLLARCVAIYFDQGIVKVPEVPDSFEKAKEAFREMGISSNVLQVASLESLPNQSLCFVLDKKGKPALVQRNDLALEIFGYPLPSRYVSRESVGNFFPCNVMVLSKLRPLSLGNAGTVTSSRNVLDLGSIEEGAIVERSVSLKNNGKTAVEIRSVRGSCTCTKAEIDATQIPPEGTVELKVTFNSVGQSGFKENKAAVLVGDQVIFVQIFSFVRTDASFFPRRVDFGRINKSSIRFIHVINRTGISFGSIVAKAEASPGFEIETRRSKSALWDWDEDVIAVRADPLLLGVGEHRTILKATVNIDSKRSMEIEIPLMAEVTR